ncbi:universal stress protein [Spirillospora albida]|uniref:universal stress protein n=1 Tax=Spirillospora albida TaxID=58123 RepID=UPI0004C09783|nr:universal stress protein [Spirillospora albida]
MSGQAGVQRPHILFGFDGTEENEPALRWAVEEARLRGLEVVMCHCWHWPYQAGHVDAAVEAIVRRAGENLLACGVRRAREMDARGTVHTRLRPEPIAEALVRESGDAELIVVGSHERERLQPGSTAVRLPALTRRPVVVVRRAAARNGLIVVGVDGSARADAALGFGIEEAELRGCALRVVWAAWEPQAVPEAELPMFGDRARLTRTRTAMLERVVAPWRDLHPKVDVDVSLVLDRPREVLLAAAEGADLLVVGDRGTGGLDPLPLGATSSAMLHHATCSVAIVPPSGTALGNG